MTRISKIPRYEAFNKAPNAFGERAQDPKKWRSYLDPELPLNLELGCGKAEVTLVLAKKYPEQNYIGIDLKADRLWRASLDAQTAGLDNTAFIQENILKIEEYIPKHTVSMIWLTHPDPYPKARHEKHRMLNRNFLDIYKNLLLPGGIVRYKTDNHAMFAWARELLEAQPDIGIDDVTTDLHAERDDEDILIETHFSKKYIAKGTAICYLQFHFTD